MGFLSIVVMSAVLGGATFGIGMLPLMFAFSRDRLAILSTIGTGLLLGAALGIIIPEGVETVTEAHVARVFPTSEVALSLIMGFTLMLLVEQFVAPHSHQSSDIPVSLRDRPVYVPAGDTDDVQFDADIEMQNGQPVASTSDRIEPQRHASDAESRKHAYPITLGLAMHGLADGLALGVSALSDSTSGSSLDLSLTVLLAIVMHKASTTLAFTLSLLSTSLPHAECKKHIAFFSASTPIGALVSYILLASIGGGAERSWTGHALLFSGGSFLYVATVLQPVSSHSQAPTSDEMGAKTRALYLVGGMFTPLFISSILGHGH